MVGYDTTALILNCRFELLQAKIGVLLFATSISTFVYFSSNNISLTSNMDATLIQLLDVESLIIQNSIFNDNNQTFLYSSTSNVIIFNSSIRNIFCNDLVFACFASISRGSLTIINSNISKIISIMNKNIISATQSQIIFRNNLFSELFALQSPIVFFLQDSSFFIQKTKFLQYQRGLIHITRSTFNSILTINESHFFNNMETDGSLASFDMTPFFPLSKLIIAQL